MKVPSLNVHSGSVPPGKDLRLCMSNSPLLMLFSGPHFKGPGGLCYNRGLAVRSFGSAKNPSCRCATLQASSMSQLTSPLKQTLSPRFRYKQFIWEGTPGGTGAEYGSGGGRGRKSTGQVDEQDTAVSSPPLTPECRRYLKEKPSCLQKRGRLQA